MRVSEIACIEVADVLQPSGQIREEVSLRAAITKGCRQRCVYLSHSKTIAALERYIEWRWERDKGAALDRGKWRGLMPQTSLILTHKGGSYELSIKRRIDEAGEGVDYLAADSLQSYVTGLYRAAGLGKGYSSHLGRRTFASRLLAQGAFARNRATAVGTCRAGSCCSQFGSDEERISRGVSRVGRWLGVKS